MGEMDEVAALRRRITRREAMGIALGLLATGLPDPVLASLSQAPAPTIRTPIATYAPQVHISHGQSWRSNNWSSMGLFGLNPQHETLVCCHVANSGAANNNVPGTMPNSAGINLPTPPDSLTGYTTVDNVAIGRAAVLAQQLFRLRAGKVLNPIIEFCVAYPSSSWTVNGGAYGSYTPGLGPGSLPWTNMLTIIAAIQALLPTQFGPTVKLTSPVYRSIGWTQGGSLASNGDTDQSATTGDFAAMTAAFDALNLPGTATNPLNFYVGIRAGLSTDTALTSARYPAIYNFCRANANGRTWGTTPWYQWPFDGPSGPAYGNIHTGPYGSIRHGEIEGYAKFVVEDEGAAAYYPLWRSLTKPIVLSNGSIMVPFDRPSGLDFTAAVLSWQSSPQDGIAVASQYGWHVRINGTEVPVTPTISGLNIVLTPVTPGALTSGQSVEVSYAMYGAGGSNPGLNAGVWGNLAMAGPTSVLFPDRPLYAWAWPFAETVTL